MKPQHRSFLWIAAIVSALTSVPQKVQADQWPNIPIPAQNAANLRAASARPADGDVATRAEHVVRALTTGGNNDAALDFFLPVDPFLAVKDMHGARRYYDQLVRMYRQDIDNYRAQFPAGATVEFVRFARSNTCTWMSIGREANRLPYWSCYGSRLIVRVNQREVSLRVHVLINWGDHWYVTHLDRIRRSQPATTPTTTATPATTPSPAMHARE